MRVAASGHILDGNRTAIGRIAKHKNHCRALAVGRLQLLHAIYFYKARANGSNGAIVAHAVGALYNHFVLHPLGVGQSPDLIRIGAGHAGSGNLTQRRGTAGRHDGVLAPHQFGNAPTDGIHQLGNFYITGRGLAHGLTHFGQRERAAQGRDSTDAVDKRPNAEIGVGRYSICAHVSLSGSGGGCGGSRGK